MRERVGQGKKATTTSFSISTLRQPTRGFGLESSEVPQAVTGQQPLNKARSHDLSRISMRPQAKLTVSQPGDVYEQEADRVAQQVMRVMSKPVNQQSVQREEAPQEEEEQQVQTKSLANSITPMVQREEVPQEEEEQQVQTKSLANSITPVVQREEAPQEEEEQQVQTKSLANSITPVVQREAMPQEEEEQQVQTKSLANFITPVVQREEAPQEEEEQQVQTKSLANSITPVVQREEAPQEEEEQQVQTKSLANFITPVVQREQVPQEEEEQQVQTKSLANFITPVVQREEMPQEEDEQQVQTKSLANFITPVVQREEMPQEEDEQAQMKPFAEHARSTLVQRKSNGNGMKATSDVETSIKQARGSGQPLGDDVRQPMEQAFGTDFSGVKIHTDSRSHDLNQSIQARAFTTGQDIFFRQGEYSPGSHRGKELLAHELTHVVQQNGSAVQAKSVSHLAAKENKIQTKAIQTKSSEKPITKSRESKAVSTPSSGKSSATNSKENSAEGDQKGEPEKANPKANAVQGEQQGKSPAKKGGLVAPPDEGGAATDPPPVDGGGAEASGNPSANKNGKNPEKETQANNKGQQKSIEPKIDTVKGAGQDQAPAEKGEAAAGLPGAAGVAAGLPGAAGVATGLPGAADAVTTKAGDGEKAPASAEDDPAFQAVVNTTKEVAGKHKEHEPAKSKAQEAQEAAEPPGNEVDSKAQANQVGEMGQAETPGFDAAAFKAKLMERIADMAPKTLEEADKFKNNNKLDSVKGDLSGKVEEEQKSSQSPLEEKAKETPDTSGIDPKQVTPLPQADPGKPPSDIGADKASPKSKGQSEVEAPLQEDSKKLDQQMAEQNITEEQLEKSNEPEFQGAVAAKKDAQTNAAQAPQQYRKQEQNIISNAQATAETTAQQHLQGMHGIRSQNLNQVADQQVGGKGKDEQARAKVAGDINKIYEKTKTQVEKTLGDLDAQVQQEFDAGAADAKKAFEDYVDQRMKAYKDDRYSGFWGPGKWLVDKLFGMPSEVNAFYQEGRQLYIEKMDGVINKVVTIISKGLTQAKTEIAKGKQQIQKYVTQLPQDLQAFGQETAAGIESKFEALQQSVDDKQDELIDTLAQKYQENLKAVDDRIEEMKAENRGLIQKAFDFIVGVIKTIIELTKMLLEVLARVASVIGKIIQDPIGFLGNLIQAVKQGFLNFMKNIGQHLQQGLIGWLTGTMAETGIQMPESFDLKGIFSLVMQVLGFTYEAIRAQAVNRLGEEKVSHLEQNFEIFKILASDGIAGLWQFVQEQIGDLQSLVLEPIKNFIIQNVITAGIEWILSLLTPASAFIKACKAIYEIVKFFIERAQQIADLINAILDSVVAIASGSIDQAIKGVENALAKSLPVVISFLASLLGLGGIVQRVQAIFQKLRRPMEKAVNWVIDKSAKAAKKVGNKFKNSKVGKKVGAVTDSVKEKYKAGKQWAEDKKGAAEQWVNDKKGAVKNKFKQSKLGQKYDSAKAWGSKKKQAAKNWLEDKKGAAKDKYKKTVDKGKEKVAQIVEWWKAKKQFKAVDGETHTLFFKGADRKSTLMVASKNPKPYTQFLEWVEGNETLNNEKIKALQEAKVIAQKIEQEKARLLPKGLSGTQKEKAMKDKAENIKKLLEDMKTPTAKLFGNDLPDWQPPKLGGVNSAGFGKWMKAEVLTRVKVGTGSAPTQAKHHIYDILNKRRDQGGSASYYVRGHLLNEKLGGEGKWENMTPLSRTGNGEHEAQFESIVKAAVNSGAIMEYHVTPIYQPRSDQSSLKKEVDKLYASSPNDATEIKEIIDAEDHVPRALTCHVQRLEKVNNKFQGIGTPREWSVINEVKRNANDYFIQNGSNKKPEPINVNSASVNDLKKIPGITQQEAEKIHEVVGKRKRPFGQYETLARDTGIALPKLKKLRENGDIVLGS
ncbi:MAG: DUF4157 domain-containing protein [Scytonema hyalinum WJT4-NPBG1]|jgi:hypothetical protein|nr:DUF4157 domain-containing protein [Scytonema hyalinum WJT4-NPBG1]